MGQPNDQLIPSPASPPNFALIAREFGKCTQLPAFDYGAAIFRSLNQIHASIQKALNQRVDGLSERVDGLSRRIDGIDQRLDGIDQTLNRIDQRLNSRDYSIMARLQNAKKANLSDTLVPLHDTSNQPIDQFPDTTSAIDGLTGDDLSRILGALGSDINGTVAEKQFALRMALGLHTV